MFGLFAWLIFFQKDRNEPKYVPENCKELTFNAKYEELWTPKCGPEDPNVSDFHKAPKNMLSGFVESASFSDFHFENQRKTYHSYGYALNPANSNQIVSAPGREPVEGEVGTVFETQKLRPKDKRKRDRNDDPSDVNGYLGPWALYKDQETVSRPTEEQQQLLSKLYAKRNRRKRRVEPEDDSKSVLHIENAYDYAGRSFLHIPQDVGVNLRSEDPPEKCFMPKQIVHTYTGHTKGIQRMKLFPVSGHLFLTCSMDSKVKVSIYFCYCFSQKSF